MPKLDTDLRTAFAAVASALSYLDIYSGSIPATGDTAPTGTKLVTWAATLSWDGGVAGVNSVTGTPLASDAALATGTAGYARLWDGLNTSMYCTVGTSGADVNLSSLSIVATGTVDLLSATVTMPAS